MQHGKPPFPDQVLQIAGRRWVDRRILHRLLLVVAIVAWSLSPGRSATLVVCTEASPDFLNAQLSVTSFDVSEQVSDRLVEMKPGSSDLVPALAQSWSISPDGLSYTFRLRHGVKFQSNAHFSPSREMNADDVVFSFRRMFDTSNPFYKSANGNFPEYLDLLTSSLQSIDKVDDDTVRFRLKSPLASFLATLSIPPFSILSAEYAVSLQKSGRLEDLDTELIGTGPFSFVQYQKDLLVRFRAFPDFWGKAGGMPDRAAGVDQLVFAITPDASVREAKLRTNECQIARYPNPSDVPALRADPHIRVEQGPIAVTNYIYFDLNRKPLDDQRVRQALAMAIDHDALAAVAFPGGTPAAGLLPPALWGYDPSLHPYPHDPDAARHLLAEAGYPNGFSTELWAMPVSRPYVPNGRRAAEMIQADWAKIGVRARIVTYEWGEYLKRTRDGEAPVAMLGDIWDYPDPSEVMLEFVCHAPANAAHFCSPAYDTPVLRADVVTDQNERARLFQQAQRAMYDAVPLVRLANVTAYVPVRREVEGFRPQPLGSQSYGGIALAK
jgi:dipeptide transport system substrate-binding protein